MAASGVQDWQGGRGSTWRRQVAVEEHVPTGRAVQFVAQLQLPHCQTAGGCGLTHRQRFAGSPEVACLTQRRDAVELGLVHEHVHVGGAGVQLLGTQEVEDGGEQGGVPVDEDLRKERKDEESVWPRRQSVKNMKPCQCLQLPFHPSGWRSGR